MTGAVEAGELLHTQYLSPLSGKVQFLKTVYVYVYRLSPTQA